MIIENGVGNGNTAKVDKGNRVHTFSTTFDEANRANIQGDAYNINTGDITLTNATETPVLYVKNNEARNLIVDLIVVGFKTSTGASPDDLDFTVVRNPTAGTIVDNATAVAINSNRNFGSSNTLTVDAYKGATGNTMTGGDDHIYVYGNDDTRTGLSINEVIPGGKSIGIKIQPPASNSSMTMYAAIVCHLEDADKSVA